MKLILLEGGPASGKSTLGEMLVTQFRERGEKSVLLDHDTYVEELRPDWTWPDEASKKKDLAIAKEKHIREINRYLAERYTVLATGGVWVTSDDVHEYTVMLAGVVSVHLFHLNVPLNVRKQRFTGRGVAPQVNMDKDQKQRDRITSWPGHVYENTRTPEKDAANLMDLIDAGTGCIPA